VSLNVNPYKLLGVNPTSSDVDVRQAYNTKIQGLDPLNKAAKRLLQLSYALIKDRDGQIRTSPEASPKYNWRTRFDLPDDLTYEYGNEGSGVLESIQHEDYCLQCDKKREMKSISPWEESCTKCKTKYFRGDKHAADIVKESYSPVLSESQVHSMEVRPASCDCGSHTKYVVKEGDAIASAELCPKNKILHVTDIAAHPAMKMGAETYKGDDGTDIKPSNPVATARVALHLIRIAREHGATVRAMAMHHKVDTFFNKHGDPHGNPYVRTFKPSSPAVAEEVKKTKHKNSCMQCGANIPGTSPLCNSECTNKWLAFDPMGLGQLTMDTMAEGKEGVVKGSQAARPALDKDNVMPELVDTHTAECVSGGKSHKDLAYEVATGGATVKVRHCAVTNRTLSRIEPNDPSIYGRVLGKHVKALHREVLNHAHALGTNTLITHNTNKTTDRLFKSLGGKQSGDMFILNKEQLTAAKYGNVKRNYTDPPGLVTKKRKKPTAPKEGDPRGNEPLTCNKCKQEKVRDDFSNKSANLKFKVDHPAHGKKQICKKCDIVAQKERHVKEMKRYKLERGGSCAHCGDTNLSKLELAHVDEHDKQFSIAKRKDHNKKKVDLEVKKTVPLCKDCHSTLTGAGSRGGWSVHKHGISSPKGKQIHASMVKRAEELASKPVK